jgi:hypothetical protein
MPATALAPGDLVIHPANARALATVVQVVGDSVAVADDLGTVATDAGASFWPSAALVALTANPRVRVGVAF